MSEPIRTREAREGDARGMAYAFVTSWRDAHLNQVPDRVLQSRTFESSEAGWMDWFATRASGSHQRERLYLAELDGAIVGVALGGPAQSPGAFPIAELYLLYVLAEYQGRGIGRRLVAAVARHLAREGMESMWVRVLKVNAPARAFYEVLGGHLRFEEQIEDEGVTMDQVVYGWPQIRTLWGAPFHPGS